MGLICTLFYFAVKLKLGFMLHILFESNGREVRWTSGGWLQTLVALPAQTGARLRNQNQTRPVEDEEDHPRNLQVAVT